MWECQISFRLPLWPRECSAFRPSDLVSEWIFRGGTGLSSSAERTNCSTTYSNEQRPVPSYIFRNYQRLRSVLYVYLRHVLDRLTLSSGSNNQTTRSLGRVACRENQCENRPPRFGRARRERAPSRRPHEGNLCSRPPSLEMKIGNRGE